MASIRKAKKMGTYKAPKYTKERALILAQTRKLVDQTNRRLKGLSNAGYKGSWASKKLINRLDTKKLKAWGKGGKVKINKNLTKTQLLSVQKAMTQFLASKTSTAKGIRTARDATIDSIRATLSSEKRGKVTEEDAEFYYEMFESDDFNYFADKIGASTLWQLIDEAIERNKSEEDWISMLSSYITLNDQDMREKAIRLYEKYIS